MDLILLVVFVAMLFALIGLAEPAAEALLLPASLVLALLGMALAGWALFLGAVPPEGPIQEAARIIRTIPIQSSLFLYVFLPILLFQMALSVEVRRMLDDWVPIFVLAVVAVVVATAFVGLALFPLAGLSLMACLMIGAIVSTTDPSAVVGILRATPSPRRLARILEGESLLNDAAAIALFGLCFAFVAFGIPNPGIQDLLWRFPWALLGGGLVGVLAGWAALWAIARLPEHPLAQVSLSVAVPLLVYAGAETLLSVSGVVTVVAAGLTLNYLAPGQLSPPSNAKLRETWELLGYWAGGLIFVLAALLIPRILVNLRPFDLVLIVVTVLAALAARAVILWGVLPVLSAARLSPKVEPRYRLAILWGGLRGAVTLALALAVTESFRIPGDIKRVTAIVATGFTLFTLLVQGSTLRALIRWLGLDRLSPLDQALAAQVVAVALQSVRETVSETARLLGLPREIVRDETKRFAERVDRAVEQADAGVHIPDRDRITLGLIALSGRERDLILEAFRERILTPALANRMLTDADRLIEATRTGGRHGYLARARRAQRAERMLALADWAWRWLGFGGLLARLTADRFEILVTQNLLLRELHRFIDERIRRIHGKRVADLLYELLERRIEGTEQALAGLRLQFPNHAEQLERRLIRRLILAQEDKEYAALVEEGLIGPELRHSLLADLEARRKEAERRPGLDVAVQRAELIASFPLFTTMDENTRTMLARALRTHHAAPGDVLLRRGEKPDRVWFIASGAVEIVRAGQPPLRLGRGEMFGHLALLRRIPRLGQATAITHSVLLTLDGDRFKALLENHAELREAVLATAAKRGIPIDRAALGLPPASLAEAAPLANGREPSPDVVKTEALSETKAATPPTKESAGAGATVLAEEAAQAEPTPDKGETA